MTDLSMRSGAMNDVTSFQTTSGLFACLLAVLSGNQSVEAGWS